MYIYLWIFKEAKKPLNFLGDTLSFNSIAKLSLDPYLITVYLNLDFINSAMLPPC